MSAVPEESHEPLLIVSGLSVSYAGQREVVTAVRDLSFAINAGGFMILVFLYALITLIVFVGSSKYNSNRPLKNVF